MKVAFACWNGRISPVFDVARELSIFEIEQGKNPVHVGDRELQPDSLVSISVNRLVENGVEVLVCGAISRSMLAVITASGIRAIPFITGEVEAVIEAWRRGSLLASGYVMPGCCRRGAAWYDAPLAMDVNEEVKIMADNDTRWMNAPGNRGGGGGGGGMGRGGMGQRGGRPQGGLGGECVCPQCGYVEPHKQGLPCMQQTCPTCGTPLTRK